MKKIINKVILFILIILIGYFTYKSYSAYKSYQVIQKSEKYTVFIKNLNTILRQIEQERSFSAMYLGYEGKTDFNHLETMREKTDSVIGKTTLFIQNNSIFSAYLESLTKLSDNLQYVRSRVDVVSSDYKSILFDYYQDEISSTVLNEIKNSAEKLSLELQDLKKYFFAYIDFIEFRNIIDKERSFIAFILSQSKKMNSSDLVLWDAVLAQEIVPAFDTLDSKIAGGIQAAVQPENFLELSFKMRVEIAKGASSGHYAIGVSRWLESVDEKIKRVELGEQIIYKYLRKEIDNIILSPKEIILNVAVLLFLMFLFLFLLFFKKSHKDTKIDIDKEKEPVKSINNNISHKKDVFHTDMSFKTKQPSKPIPKAEDESKVVVNEVESFNAIKEFETTIEYFVDKATGKNIQYNYYIDPTIPVSCIGDLAKIKQILANLINHAIDFTPVYGTINVRIDKIAEKKTESAVKFSVIDSGSYISKEHKHRIMQVFYQKNIIGTKNILKIEPDLTLAAEQVFLMDGVFEIESELKKGSVLSFTLALKKDLI